jgi:signal transduction histidine kinase
MSAETATINGAAAVLAEDPYRAVAEHLPDAAVVLFDRDLRVRLATATRDRAGLDACEVTVDLDGPPLDPMVETALFRVAQQALANVEQHANARRLWVALYRDGPEVVLVVQDDGCGFDPAHTQAVADTHGFGLTCMRERLQAIGGQLTLRSVPGAGTRIQAQAAAQAPA